MGKTSIQGMSGIGPHIEWVKLYEKEVSGTFFSNVTFGGDMTHEDRVKYYLVAVSVVGQVTPYNQSTMTVRTGGNGLDTAVSTGANKTSDISIISVHRRVFVGDNYVKYESPGTGPSSVDYVALNGGSGRYALKMTVFGGNFVY